MIIFRNLSKFSLKHLNKLQVAVTQDKMTEAPFSSSLLDIKENGKFLCVVCENQLFEAGEKFDSGSGWPSFFKPVDGSVKFCEDFSHGMARVEVVCGKCDSHLGHYFPDGPKNSRYCINGCCLNFVPNPKI